VADVSDKSRRENQNTHFTFNNFFPRKSAIYEIMWKNIKEPERPQMTIWLTRIACWIPKATNTHSEIRNNHCFSIATMVARTRLSVTLYVLRLPCSRLHITYKPPWLLWSFRIEPTLTETVINSTWSVNARKYADWNWNALNRNIPNVNYRAMPVKHKITACTQRKKKRAWTS
jgi:hypothetical protein